MKKCISMLLLLVLCLTMTTGLAEDRIFEGQKIVYTTWGNASEQTAVQALLDKFTAETGCEVEFICIAENYDTKVTAMLAANEQIDLAQMESGTIGFKLAEEGYYARLDEMAAASGYDIANYAPGSCYKDDAGNLIAYSGCIELMTLFYNKDVFDAANIAYPAASPKDAWTWDEFVDVCKKLTVDANGKTPYDEGFDPENIVRYGINIGFWWPTWGSFVESNGGKLVVGEEFTMNQPAATEALQKLADLALVHHVMPLPTARAGLPGTDIALLTGTYAMVVDGQWVCQTVAEAGANFGVGSLPKMGEEVVSVSCNGMFCIMEASEHKDAAWYLLTNYLQDPAADITLYENGNLMPADPDWLTNPEKLALWAAEDNPARPTGYEGVIEMLMNNTVPPYTGSIKNFPDMIDIVNVEVDYILSGEKTAQQAMDDAAAKIEQAGIKLGVRAQ